MAGRARESNVNANRYVNIGFVLGGLLAWIVLTPFFAWIFNLLSPKLDVALVGQDLRLSNVLGLAVAVAGTAVLFVREQVYRGAVEIANELLRVTWPKWDETFSATRIVIVTTIVVALILGLFDFVWAKLSGFVYGVKSGS